MLVAMFGWCVSPYLSVFWCGSALGVLRHFMPMAGVFAGCDGNKLIAVNVQNENIIL